MTDIYAFPPVGLVSVTLREDRPVRRAAYALSGKRVVASGGPSRREVQITASALSRDRAGAGYLAQLWRYIDGGMGLVRLVLPPQNWHLDRAALASRIGNNPVTWTDGGSPLDWTDGVDDLFWFANPQRPATVTTLSGYPHAVEVTALPPSIIVARPGDILRVYEADGSSTVARVMDLTRSDASGVAVVPVASALPAGVASFADEESAVFEVMDYTPQGQGVGRNWTVSMGLREVLASEIDTPTEVNPWRA